MQVIWMHNRKRRDPMTGLCHVKVLNVNRAQTIANQWYLVLVGIKYNGKATLLAPSI